MRRRTSLIAATGVAAALLAGAGVAYSNNHSSSRESFLDDFAHHLGVSPNAVRSAWQATIKDQLDQAVKDGRLTQTEANALLAHLGKHTPFDGPTPFDGLPPGLMRHGGGDNGPPPWAGPKPGKGHFAHPLGEGLMGAAASYLGLSLPELFSQLHGGTSPAQIATQQGKSVAGLEAAMVSAQRARLDDAVKHGLLKEHQAAKLESHLEQMIHELVHHGFHGDDRDDDDALHTM